MVALSHLDHRIVAVAETIVLVMVFNLLLVVSHHLHHHQLSPVDMGVDPPHQHTMDLFLPPAGRITTH